MKFKYRYQLKYRYQNNLELLKGYEEIMKKSKWSPKSNKN